MGQRKSAVLLEQTLIVLLLSTTAYTCPHLCKCVDSKVDCYGKGLTEIPNDFPPDVTSIDLQYNEIETVRDQFHNLTSLQEVMLRFNRISSLAEGAFSDLPNLEHINLGSNVLTNLSSGVFQNVSQMRILDLTDNRLSSVDGAFEGVSSLTKLVLTRNLLEELIEDSLKPLKKLIYFMADENQIAYVHPAAFHGLHELSFMSLLKNPLSSMDDVLSTNTLLSYLNLDECQLTRVPTGLPWATRNLELRRNNITAISRDTFTDTQYLGTIMLDGNKITHVDPDSFTPLVHLQELWLNGNQLTTLPTPIPSTVQVLSMDNNDLTTVSSEDFPHDSQLKTLSLTGNRINDIEHFTFSRLVHLEKLYLGDNNITRLPSKSFFGMRNLTLLELGDNPIAHIHERFAASLHKLDILNLSYVSDSEPNMRGNFFRDIPFLKTLLLRSSPLLARAILTSNETRKSFYNLQRLDLRDNDLETVDFDLPRFFPNLQQMQLSGNAWICDPRLLWLQDWMKKARDIFLHADRVVCVMPAHLAGEVIADLPYHAFFYTTTVPTTSTTTEEVEASGDVDNNYGTDSGESAKLTTDSLFPNVTAVVETTTAKMKTPSSTPTRNNNDSAEKTSKVKGQTKPTTATPMTTTKFSKQDKTIKKSVPTSTHPSTSRKTTKKSPRTTKSPQSKKSTQTSKSPQSKKSPQTTKSPQTKQTTKSPQTKQTTKSPQTKQTTKSPQTKKSPQTTKSSHTKKTPHTTKYPQTKKSPHTTKYPQTKKPPHTTKYPQTKKSPQTTKASTPTSSSTNTPTTTTILDLTDIPRHGGSKTSSSSSPSKASLKTIIMATCVAGIALIIIVVVALVLILRHKRRIRLVVYRALTPRSEDGDTELVLNDQDEPDCATDSNAMTELSESEQGSITPRVEVASDDGLHTKLVDS